MNPRQQTIAILVLLVALIGGFTFYAALPLLGQHDVILKTRPVDPFDPLRGQYLIIAYEIGTVEIPPGVKQGDRVYVALSENGGVWSAAGVYTTKPEGVFIRGKVVDTWNEQMEVRFGIEQYFFERNAEFNATNLTVHARIDGAGRARIVELLHDGKPLEIEYRN